MRKPTVSVAVLLLAVTFVLPMNGAAAKDTASAAGQDGLIPVVVWQVSRPGSLPSRTTWMVGTDAMFRLTYDDGKTWYGFKPLFADSEKGFLAVRAFQGKGTADGEQDWTEKAAVTVVQGRPATVRLGDEPELSIEILEFKTVSVRDLKRPEAHNVEPEGPASG